MSSCVASAYCKPFGPEKEFGLIGECVPLDSVLESNSQSESDSTKDTTTKINNLFSIEVSEEIEGLDSLEL
jgi:hypothetical protein